MSDHYASAGWGYFPYFLETLKGKDILMSLEVKEATLTLRAGKSTTRTTGYLEIDDEQPNMLRIVVEQNTSTSRFFAANYGRRITIEATPR